VFSEKKRGEADNPRGSAAPSQGKKKKERRVRKTSKDQRERRTAVNLMKKDGGHNSGTNRRKRERGKMQGPENLMGAKSRSTGANPANSRSGKKDEFGSLLKNWRNPYYGREFRTDRKKRAKRKNKQGRARRRPNLQYRCRLLERDRGVEDSNGKSAHSFITAFSIALPF